mmetsp:Transcript_11433/g.26431  ORF Transcript_11433/g.26431 Transcript_11433/m.26431 type:complete len:800 (+) Transcript_11433:73-2472(+)
MEEDATAAAQPDGEEKVQHENEKDAPADADQKEDDDEVVVEELDDEGNPTEESTKDKDKDPTQAEMDRIEKEKDGMTVAERLDTAYFWKAQGNSQFKNSELVNACDSYYRAIVYCRELTQNPQYYPKLGHDEQQRKIAKDIHESAFSNLALVQCKYAGESLALDDPRRSQVLAEAVKSADAALKINADNVKAMFRRGQARMLLAKAAPNAEAQELYTTAKADFTKVMQLDPKNRDAHTELGSAQQELKRLKKEEVAKERKEFSFASTLSGLGAKETDVLGDGTVRKIAVVKNGNGGKWLEPDWLKADHPSKCVVQVALKRIEPDGAEVKLSFSLGDPDMHDGMLVAVKALTLGERAKFVFASSRLAVKSSLTAMLPKGSEGEKETTWEVEFLKFEMWQDAHRDGSQLSRIPNEGYGRFPEPLAECHLHWRVYGADATLLHSSRFTMSMGGSEGLKQVEDEEKAPSTMVLEEGMWSPLATLCKSLRQGGRGELRLRLLPALTKELTGGGGDNAASMQLSMLMRKNKAGEKLRHCIVEVELERVVLALTGPSDADWQGVPSLVHERLRAENLLSQGEEAFALRRCQRIVEWAQDPSLGNEEAALEQQAEARATAGWILVSRAAPVLDAGTVSSAELAAARKDLAEAEAHHQWLSEHRPSSVGCHLIKAKILLAEDDDFPGAHDQLLQAQSLAPNDPRVQAELRRVKVELRRAEENESKKRVIDIREGLKRARLEDGSSKVSDLLKELSQTSVSWDVVMDTRIGVELKNCREAGDEGVKTLCDEILAKFKDESKQQRPMWES